MPNNGSVKLGIDSFPSLSEQKIIVKKLNESFGKIEELRKIYEANLNNSKELWLSLLHKTFDVTERESKSGGEKWQIKRLGEVCDILDNKRKPITKRNRTAGEYPYYGATGVLDYVSDYIFDEKLILIGEDGAKWESGENTAFIADGKYWVNNHAHVIRPHRNIILDNWIVYLFYLADLTKYTTGLTVPKLNQANFRNIEIPLPSLSEQKSIVKKLDALSAETKNLETIYKKKLADLEELKKSVLKKAFAGEL